MSPFNPIFALLVLAVAVAFTFALRRLIPAPATGNRYSAIDGLRGYLALSVFIHHSIVWFLWLQHGKWENPPTNFLTELGQGSVALFFMITAFLFAKKVILKDEPIDWLKLFVSRLCRLFPLYAVVITAVVLVVAIETNWTLREPALSVAQEVAKWFAFTMYKAHSINQFERTAQITAGVTWSLRYEWFFYFSLPVIAFVFKRKVPINFLLLSVASVAVAVMAHLNPGCLLGFVGGFCAAVLHNNKKVRDLADSRLGSALVMLCLAYVWVFCPTAYALLPMLVLTVAFILIAAGCSMFGILSNPTSRTLGEPTYSIYLLHGVLLYVVFTFVIGHAALSRMSPLTYCAIVLLLTPLLLGISFLSFRWIESPTMELAPVILGKLHNLKAELPTEDATPVTKNSPQ